VFVPLGVIVGGRGWGFTGRVRGLFYAGGGKVKPSGGVTPRGAGIGGVNL